jgi:hypothetical protein
MSHCYPFVAVDVCCDRPGLRSWLRQPGGPWLLVVAVLLLFLLSVPGGGGGGHPRHPDWAARVCGTECHARPSVALAHLSARAKSVGTVSTSCVANFSSIFSSRTPCRKAMMMEASEMRGMVPRTLVKREMNFQRVSPGSCLTAWRWASTPCCW